MSQAETGPQLLCRPLFVGLSLLGDLREAPPLPLSYSINLSVQVEALGYAEGCQDSRSRGILKFGCSSRLEDVYAGLHLLFQGGGGNTFPEWLLFLPPPSGEGGVEIHNPPWEDLSISVVYGMATTGAWGATTEPIK